ncbi:hypothetical protein OHS58_03885 [Amycolatopsis sp. NBC_00348]|uniref:hypothetical protein n=1 Tax=Amycolatopsis sp. NBC_00348 TaxID=2975956 RepID=UPI002E266E71
MTTPNPRPARTWARLAGAAAVVAACAVCCAGPLLVLLGGLGVGSMVGAIWDPALALLAAAAVVAIFVVRWRRRVAACASNPGPVELGLPAVGADTGEPAPPHLGG